MLAYLKIKIVSLAAEAQLIRKDEKKYKARHRKRGGDLTREIYLGLRQHRTDVVRSEARHALLAYGFLRGTPYGKMESPGKRNIASQPNLKRVLELIVKYGVNKDSKSIDKALSLWFDPETANR